MKCSYCGSVNIKGLDINKIFRIKGEANLETRAVANICLDCGHIELFDDLFVSEYKVKVKANTQIEHEIELKVKQINEIKDNFDPKLFNNEINKLEKEIKKLESIDVTGGEINKRRRKITENKEIIATKVDPKYYTKVLNLEREIEELKSKLQEL